MCWRSHSVKRSQFGFPFWPKQRRVKSISFVIWKKAINFVVRKIENWKTWNQFSRKIVNLPLDLWVKTARKPWRYRHYQITLSPISIVIRIELICCVFRLFCVTSPSILGIRQSFRFVSFRHRHRSDASMCSLCLCACWWVGVKVMCGKAKLFSKREKEEQNANQFHLWTKCRSSCVSCTKFNTTFFFLCHWTNKREKRKNHFDWFDAFQHKRKFNFIFVKSKSSANGFSLLLAVYMCVFVCALNW